MQLVRDVEAELAADQALMTQVEEAIAGACDVSPYATAEDACPNGG